MAPRWAGMREGAGGMAGAVPGGVGLAKRSGPRAGWGGT